MAKIQTALVGILYKVVFPVTVLYKVVNIIRVNTHEGEELEKWRPSPTLTLQISWKRTSLQFLQLSIFTSLFKMIIFFPPQSSEEILFIFFSLVFLVSPHRSFLHIKTPKNQLQVPSQFSVVQRKHTLPCWRKGYLPCSSCLSQYIRPDVGEQKR